MNHPFPVAMLRYYTLLELAEVTAKGNEAIRKFIDDWRKNKHNLKERPEFIDGAQPMKPTCGRCYEETEVIHKANCDEKPETLLGEPLGQYHCPDCGAMVIAGIPHPGLCLRCLKREHPGFDSIDGEQTKPACALPQDEPGKDSLELP